GLWRIGMFRLIPGCDQRRLHQMIHADGLAQRAETCPDRLALIAGGVALTYEELEAEASRAARRLAARGVRRGGNVVIAQPSGLAYVITLHPPTKLAPVVHP